MVKKSNRSSQPSPQPETVAAEQPETANETATDTAENIIAMRPGKASRGNIFEQRQQEISKAVADKVQQLSEARQRLAEASDLYGEGSAKEKEAKEAAAKAAILLYRARTAGTITPDELSGILGDQFGFKPKQNGEPSKTPLGQGEAIRKRIVRAVQAHEYVNGGDGGRFFSGLPEDECEDILHRMTDGSLGFWAAYEAFAELKRDNQTKVSPAFDPKRIAAIAEALAEEGAARHFVNNKALEDAYTGLFTVLQIVGEQAAELRKKAA